MISDSGSVAAEPGHDAPAMTTREAVAAMSALAHEGRLNAFRILVQAGHEGVASGEVARRLGIPPNTLSASLNVLSNAGLIESRREGKSMIYTVRYAHMSQLLAFLVEDCCAGSSEICAPLMTITLHSCCEAGEQA